MQKRYFGTDGIRSAVGSLCMNGEFMLKLGWAAALALTEAKQSPATVIIGHDTRGSCQMLVSALQAGFASAGARVINLGVVPTPAVAFLTRELQATLGVVMSASHNAYQDNGVKFFNARGMKINDAVELKIESLLSQPLTTAPCDALQSIQYLEDARQRYTDFCRDLFETPLQLKGVKLVVDCAHGAMYQIAPALLQQLGASVTAIGVEPDGCNINAGYGATDVVNLQAAVKQYQADIGLAFDGDGDRLIMVDHLGEVVDGDELLAILANQQKAQQQTALGVVGTVMSNLGLEQALQRLEIPFVRAAVGDRYVLEELNKQQWVLGGESSGHLINLNYMTTGDGLVSALQILRIMSQQQQDLHSLKQVMLKCPQTLINVPINAMFDWSHFPRAQQAIKEAEQSLQGCGRVLLRPSGTERCVRVMVEGNDAAQVLVAAKQLASVVEKEALGDAS